MTYGTRVIKKIKHYKRESKHALTKSCNTSCLHLHFRFYSFKFYFYKIERFELVKSLQFH